MKDTVEAGLAEVLGGKELEAYNDDFIKINGSSASHRIAGVNHTQFSLCAQSHHSPFVRCDTTRCQGSYNTFGWQLAARDRVAVKGGRLLTDFGGATQIVGASSLGISALNLCRRLQSCVAACETSKEFQAVEAEAALMQFGAATFPTSIYFCPAAPEPEPEQ